MSELITDRTTLDLVYMTEKAVNDGIELVRLRNQKARLLQELQIIARWAKQPDTTLDAIYHLATVTLETAEAR